LAFSTGICHKNDVIKIFRVVSSDSNSITEEKYQTLILDHNVFKTEAERVAYVDKHLDFRGISITEWNPPPMMPLYPSRKKPDFWHIGYGHAFAVGERVFKNTSGLDKMLAKAGQLLPLPFQNQTLTVCNILAHEGCIDEEKSGWVIRQYDGIRVRPDRPFFIAGSLPESSLFKISQSPGTMFAWEKDQDPEQEFKACVEKNKLTGLNFSPIWSEEEGIISKKIQR
jgi:hypothetical protein